MKTNYFRIVACSAMMLAYTFSAFAADYYVSALGSDSNNGSKEAPFETIDKAVSIAVAEDVIYISGKITLSRQVDIADYGDITFKGIDNAIIDGNNKTRLFYIRGIENITFEDLTLQNGYTEANDDTDGRGAAINLGSGSVTLKNCTVIKNSNECLPTGNNQGGAVFADGSTFTAINSTFENNESFQGGFMFAVSSTVTLRNCDVLSNQALDASLNTHSEDARGGALMTNNCQLNIKDTNFSFNLSQGMGGVGFIAGSGVDQEYYFERCLIYGNNAGAYGEYEAHSGAFFFGDGKMKLTMVNTTIANNSCTSAGGLLMAEAANSNSEFIFINVTATNNQTFNNLGNCGGFRFLGDNHKIYIYNSIIEGNYSYENSAYSDLSFIGSPRNLVVENSIIGNIVNNGTTVTDLGNVKNSTINTMPEEPFVAGLDEELDDELGVWRVTDGGLALGYGDAKFLQDININTDQLNLIRPFTNGKCDAGAWEKDSQPNSIGRVQTVDLRVSPNPVKDILTITASVEGKVVVEVYDITGRKVKVLANEVADGTYQRSFDVAGYLNGLYFVKVNGESLKFIKK